MFGEREKYDWLSEELSKENLMDHGDTKACLGDHFADFCLVVWSQNIQDEKKHLMFIVMNNETISF